MREPFLERLERRVVVCDGAMGTRLYARGIPFTRCFDELNLTAPHLVKEVHLSYVKAGAEVIETNTFGANRFRLNKFGLADKVREIALASARLAREVAGDDLYVAGSVGPLGLRLEPLGPTSLEEAREAFHEQIAALAEGGVDLIMIETMIDLNEARQALLAARDVESRISNSKSHKLPVVVEMTIQEDGSTPAGTVPEDFARQLDEWGADLIGINCSVGPAPVLEALERVARVTHKKLAAQPNAGLPTSPVQGRSIYLCSPEYMASYAKRFIDVGARLIGGCCGTTPEHIRAIKAAVRSASLPPARVTIDSAVARPLRPLESVPFEKRSRLAARLANREFPILIEVVPPKGPDPTKELEGAQFIVGRGIDTVNVPDGSGSAARMSAQTLAAILQQRAAIEVLLQYSCRDRNVLRIQSDLLGAHALGVRNIFAVTGDPPPFAAEAATAMFDVDSIGLVNILSNLNRGLDAGGNPLGGQTSFAIGVGVNPFAPDPDEQFRRFEYKVEAGADFAVTQPVFDVSRLLRFIERLESSGLRCVPLIASLYPLTSLRNAEFLNNEVPGIVIPPTIMDRMRKADTGERARAEGVRIAQEILSEIRDLVNGIHLVPPLGRYAMALEVTEALGSAPRSVLARE